MLVLETIARGLGGRVIRRHDAPIGLTIDLPPEARVPYLAAVAAYYARHEPQVRQIAGAIMARGLHDGLGTSEIPAVLLYAVQHRVAYVPERAETFASPLATWDTGFGDCDDSACLLSSLADSVAIPSRLVAMRGESGQVSHVCAQLHDGAGWRWAEATLRARFGEHPFRARDRLRERAEL